MIHAEPRMHNSVPDMAKLECTNTESDVRKTTDRTYGKTGRMAHASISPVTDTGPCVRRRSLPANPAPRPRAVELKASSASFTQLFGEPITVKPKIKTPIEMTRAKVAPPKEVSRESKAEVPVCKTETVAKEKVAVEIQKPKVAEPIRENKTVGAQKILSAVKSEPKNVTAKPKIAVVAAAAPVKAVKKAVKEPKPGPSEPEEDKIVVEKAVKVTKKADKTLNKTAGMKDSKSEVKCVAKVTKAEVESVSTVDTRRFLTRRVIAKHALRLDRTSSNVATLLRNEYKLSNAQEISVRERVADMRAAYKVFVGRLREHSNIDIVTLDDRIPLFRSMEQQMEAVESYDSDPELMG